jgi:hypothetical protein
MTSELVMTDRVRIAIVAILDFVNDFENNVYFVVIAYPQLQCQKEKLGGQANS